MNDKILLLGGVMIDTYMHITYYPKLSGDTLIEEIHDYVGGCPFNVALALKNLNLKPLIYSALGDDDRGRFIIKKLQQENFIMDTIFEVPNTQTGQCFIMLDQQKERTFFAKHEIEGYFDETIISNDIIEDITYIYLTGIFMIYPPYSEKIVLFLEKMATLGKKIIFDVAPMVNEIETSLLKRLLKITYLLKTNDTEEKNLLTKLQISNLSKSFPIPYIIKTCGIHGSYLIHPEQIEVKAQQAHLIDSNGAGDNYLAGVIYGLIHKYDMEKTLHFASACGRLACETLGTYITYTQEDVLETLIP